MNPGNVRIFPSTADVNFLQSEFDVSRETMELFQVYVDLLVEWQGKTNLVSNSSLADVWRRHICDSTQCKSVLPDKMNWMDIGSGAGFPGLVISILQRNEPGFKMQLVESNQKKCAFLRKVIRETGLSAEVSANRIESVTKQSPDVEVVCARALASLEKLFGLTYLWFEAGAVGLFPKGRDYLQELENCRGRWQFDLLVHESLIEKNSVLLEIQNLEKIGA